MVAQMPPSRYLRLWRLEVRAQNWARGAGRANTSVACGLQIQSVSLPIWCGEHGLELMLAFCISREGGSEEGVGALQTVDKGRMTPSCCGTFLTSYHSRDLHDWVMYGYGLLRGRITV